jgi:hypothetical protein
MISTTLDMHELVKELKQVGFDERQAEVQVYTSKSIVDAAITHLQEEIKGQWLATKYDLKLVEKDLRLEIKQLEAGLNVKIEKTKNSILCWSFGMCITQVGLIFGLYWKMMHLF